MNQLPQLGSFWNAYYRKASLSEYSPPASKWGRAVVSNSVETDSLSNSGSDSGYSSGDDSPTHSLICLSRVVTTSDAGSLSRAAYSSQIWHQKSMEFEQYVAELSADQLGRLGATFPADGTSLDDDMSTKIRIFYRAVMKELKESEEDISWLENVMIPMQPVRYKACSKVLRQGYFNDDIMIKICERLEKIATPEALASFPKQTLVSITNTVAIMAEAGFYDPVLGRIIAHTLNNMVIPSTNLDRYLHLARTGMLLHAVARETSRNGDNPIVDGIKTAITKLEAFSDSQSVKHVETRASIIHWLQAYGYYVLQMNIKPPANNPHGSQPVISSRFQKNIFSELQHKLPADGLREEKILEHSLLSADIYCEPGIVIEIDGHKYHHREYLSLRGKMPSSWRENGKTVAKRQIMLAAGYSVINISEDDERIIERTVEKVTELRRAVAKSVQVILLKRKPDRAVSNPVTLQTHSQLNPYAIEFIPRSKGGSVHLH